MGHLYPIIDEAVCRRLGLGISQVFSAILRASPDIVQFRAKGLSDQSTLEHLRELVALRNELSPSTRVFANDRADLAELGHTDGVHVGQDDMPVSLVREYFPRLQVGVSTHDRAQLESALLARPDYVALGPIFPTASKLNPEPIVGLEGLKELGSLARAAGIPLVAIGGITKEALPEVLEWADHVALISALLAGVSAHEDPWFVITETTRALGRPT